MKRVWVTACVLGMLGCGGDSEKPPRIAGERDPDASRPRPRDSGSDPVDAGSDAEVPQRGPIIEFLSPDAARDPVEDTVITDRMVTVRCRVTRREGGAAVDPGSIVIAMDRTLERMTERVTAAVDAVSVDEFEARFDVGAMPNGTLRFYCDASDLAATPEKSSVSRTTLLDLGPTIEILQPKDKGTFALRTPVVMQVRVLPAPLADDDPEAAVADIDLSVSGVEFTLEESEDQPGVYQTSVDFEDKTLFSVAPTSAEIVVSARNGRTPQAGVRSAKRDIGIDGQGPTIVVEDPPNASIQRTPVTLKLQVSDPAGIAEGSVRAVINAGLLEIDDWRISGSTYTQRFNVHPTQLTKLTQLTFNIYARDTVGNETTVDHLVRLDNVPPLVSLDPPSIRHWRKNGTAYYCSEEFDPVGSDAISDGDNAKRSSYYRVLVNDQTNYSPGAEVGYYAGVNQNKVELFAQPDPSIPLLIDTNGDDICDQINETPSEGSAPTQIQLRPVTPRGSPWYPRTPALSIQLSNGATCTHDPAGPETEPDTLCNATAMRRVVPGLLTSKPPAIYALNPTNGSTDACTGDTWELLPIVGQGWACVAARAEDNEGNVGISAPLRVCFSEFGEIPCDEAAKPSCLKDCTISAAQQYSANIIWEQR